MGYLQELNPDVNGDYIDENVDIIIESNPEFFKNFCIVVTCALSEKTLVKLSNLLWDYNIPLMACRSVGFFASARMQVRELCIIESHPDNKHNDIRLEEPFDALKDYINVSSLIYKAHFVLKMITNFLFHTEY
jgi:amyloid beta precursor protein binding protein 1